MQPTKNPFTPLSGQRPPFLAGRAAEVAAFDQLIGALGRGGDAEPLVFAGSAGVGKTALFGYLVDQAVEAQWLAAVATVHKGQSVVSALAEGFDRLVLSLSRNRPGMLGLDRLQGAVAGLCKAAGIEPSVAFAPDPATSRGNLLGDLHALFRIVGDGMASIQRGMVLFLDDVHHGTDQQLGVLGQAVLDAAERGLPVTVVAAAGSVLPSFTRVGQGGLAARVLELASLNFYEVQEALNRPAGEHGVSFQHGAARAIAERSGGAPLLIQALAAAAWDLARANVVDVETVEQARSRAEALFLSGYVAPLLDRLAPTERRYLRAVGELRDQRVNSLVVARKLGDNTRFGESSALAAVRDGLLRAGLLYSPDGQEMRFTLPPLAAALPMIA